MCKYFYKQFYNAPRLRSGVVREICLAVWLSLTGLCNLLFVTKSWIEINLPIQLAASWSWGRCQLVFVNMTKKWSVDQSLLQRLWIQRTYSRKDDQLVNIYCVVRSKTETENKPTYFKNTTTYSICQGNVVLAVLGNLGSLYTVANKFSTLTAIEMNALNFIVWYSLDLRNYRQPEY